MIHRIALALLSATIGAVIAAAISLVASSLAFVVGVYCGSKFEDEKTETTEQE